MCMCVLSFLCLLLPEMGPSPRRYTRMGICCGVVLRRKAKFKSVCKSSVNSLKYFHCYMVMHGVAKQNHLQYG